MCYYSLRNSIFWGVRYITFYYVCDLHSTFYLNLHPIRSTTQFGEPRKHLGIMLHWRNDGSGLFGLRAVALLPRPILLVSLGKASNGLSTCALPSIDSPVNTLIASLTKLYDSESMSRILVMIDEVREITSCDSILFFAVLSIQGHMKSLVIKREFISLLKHDRL